MDEKDLYSDNNIRITPSHVIVDGETYSFKNITSTKITTTKPNHNGAIAILVAALVFLPISAGVFLRPKVDYVGLGISFLMIVSAMFLILKRRKLYHLTIIHASVEHNILSSMKKAYIEKIIAFINTRLHAQ